MKIRVLGCSGGIGQGLRTTSFLINDSVLLDAGTGVGELSLEEMSNIKHIFITHSHLDHVSFIPLLVDSVFENIFDPIVVHAQPATLKALKDHIFNWTIWPDFTELPAPAKGVLTFEEMRPGETLKIDGCDFEMIQVNHIVPAVGYRIEHDGKSFAFSGDTSTNDSFWDALNKHKGLDVLVVETAFPEKQLDLAILSKHYTPSLLAADIEKFKHTPDIYLTHLKSGDEDQIINDAQRLMPNLSFKILEQETIFKL